MYAVQEMQDILDVLSLNVCQFTETSQT